MKNTIKYLSFVCILLTIPFGFSCKKYLTVTPDDGIYNQSYWRNQKDLENAVGGCYASLAKSVRRIFVMSEIRSDLVSNGLVIDDSRVGMYMLKNGIIASDNLYVKWGDFYSTINLCNAVIKNAHKILENDQYAIPADVQALISEAYYIRSLNYFYLVRFFKDVPLVLEPSDNDQIDFNVAKSADTAVLNLVIKDLEENKNNVPAEYTTMTMSQANSTDQPDDRNRVYSNVGRATKGAFYSLLADVYLWNEQYQKCVDACDTIIASNKYVLVPQASWYEIFYASTIPSEHIFSILFLNDGSSGVTESEKDEYSWKNDIRKMTQSNSYLVSSSILTEMLGENSTDIRGNGGSFIEASTLIWKWGGTKIDKTGTATRLTSGTYADPHWICYRYADILLMKAEASVELGNTGTAQTLVNLVRARANAQTITDLPGDKNSAELMVLNERALELAFEGKRWFDLMRFARRNNYEQIDYLIDQEVAAAGILSYQSVRAACLDPLGWYYPIFQDDINKNTKLVQNPFYIR